MNRLLHYDSETKAIKGFYSTDRKVIPTPVALVTEEQFDAVNEGQHTHVGDITPEYEARRAELVDGETVEVQFTVPAVVIDTYRVEPEKTSDEIRYLAKSVGFVYQDLNVSIDAENQHGVADILAGVNLAIELGMESELFPIYPLLNTHDGEGKLKFTSAEEYKLFALTFFSARQVLYPEDL